MRETFMQMPASFVSGQAITEVSVGLKNTIITCTRYRPVKKALIIKAAAPAQAMGLSVRAARWAMAHLLKKPGRGGTPIRARPLSTKAPQVMGIRLPNPSY